MLPREFRIAGVDRGVEVLAMTCGTIHRSDLAGLNVASGRYIKRDRGNNQRRNRCKNFFHCSLPIIFVASNRLRDRQFAAPTESLQYRSCWDACVRLFDMLSARLRYISPIDRRASGPEKLRESWPCSPECRGIRYTSW